MTFLLLAMASLAPGPTLSLPWAEHGELTRLTGRAPLGGYGQEAYVVPQRPGKNLVRYFEYNWRDFDYLDDDGSSGVRFYFYNREYQVARIAAGLVRESWRYLSDRFQYKPSVKVPYILYNTYREFLETNVFEVQEGILGVTSPQDLRMTLPYAGEKEMFKMVSTHEMTHQFQIQKVQERAASAGLESPIGAFPLWFTEGLAEYYAHNQQMDSETEMFLRDIVLNPNGEIGYDFPSLEEDRPYAYLYTYKYGQAKLVFLSETYGERVIQGVLDQSPRLAGGGRQRGEPRENFMALLGHVAGETPAQMNARWQTWARKRVMRTYLDSRQDLPDVTELKLPDEMDNFTSSKDGNLIFYRGVERDTGRAKLVLIDRRDPSSATQIAIDQHPGTESLHPVLRSVMAVSDTGIAWFAQSGDSDVLHYRAMKRRERRESDSPRVRVDLDLGETKVIRVVNDGLIEAGDPTFSPDGTQLAFYGLDREGKEDIYTLDLRDEQPHVKRHTNDRYSERDLSWGDDGIVYSCDATESSRYNLFRIDPATDVRVRLTDAPIDQRYPVALPGEAVIFASDAEGKSDLWFLQYGRIKRLTDFATAVSHPGLGPNGIYGVAFYGARFRLFEMSSENLLAADEQDAIPAAYLATLDKPQGFPDEADIPQDAPQYNPYAVGRNWRVEGGGASIGGAGIGYAPVGSGGVLFADIMRDRSALVNLAIYGSFSLTDALAFYVDKSERLIWGIGAFHTFQQGRDTEFPSARTCFQPVTLQNQGNACEVLYLQREYGVEGLLSYPISTFSRFDATARLMGVDRSFFDNFAYDRFGNPSANIPAIDLNQIRGGDAEAELSGSWGWDTTRYGLGGAIGGTSVLVTLGVGDLPTRSDGAFAFVQEDAIQTFRIIGRAKLNFRLASGLSQGSRFRRTFYLSSFDNLRGFSWSDPRLLGDGYYVGQAEFQFPLDILIRFAFFSGITGVVGFDFGGVVDTSRARQDYPDRSHLNAAITEAWANRTADYVLGVNLGLGPFELRVQFAHGIDIGGLIPQTDQNGNPTWVPNISLHYAYF